MLTERLENEEYAAAFRSKGPQDSAEVFVNSFDIPATENDKQVNTTHRIRTEEDLVSFHFQLYFLIKIFIFARGTGTILKET